MKNARGKGYIVLGSTLIPVIEEINRRKLKKKTSLLTVAVRDLSK